ncbi:HNH endonuclease [Cellulomonas sp. ES6]|uniref:HNH endonuclease n=1 Tax=Cellulomonas sp. ES6 TaxID=3039384 RepID=UPI0032D5807B
MRGSCRPRGSARRAPARPARKTGPVPGVGAYAGAARSPADPSARRAPGQGVRRAAPCATPDVAPQRQPGTAVRRRTAARRHARDVGQGDGARVGRAGAALRARRRPDARGAVADPLRARPRAPAAAADAPHRAPARRPPVRVLRLARRHRGPRAPRSRGGRHEWTNVVAACRRCNHRKADHLLHEIGWELAWTPSAPRGATAFLRGVAADEPAWSAYLAA